MLASSPDLLILAWKKDCHFMEVNRDYEYSYESVESQKHR